MNEELIEFQMQKIDERFDRIEKMIEKLLASIDALKSFRYQIVGGAVVLSALVSFAIEFLKK